MQVWIQSNSVHSSLFYPRLPLRTKYNVRDVLERFLYFHRFWFWTSLPFWLTLRAKLCQTSVSSMWFEGTGVSVMVISWKLRGEDFCHEPSAKGAVTWPRVMNPTLEALCNECLVLSSPEAPVTLATCMYHSRVETGLTTHGPVHPLASASHSFLGPLEPFHVFMLPTFFFGLALVSLCSNKVCIA
jgi:hypothetical protein